MNTKWLWLGLLTLICATPAFAAHTNMHQLDIKTCRMSGQSIHDMWQHQLFDAPANVSAMMVAAMDGQTGKVQTTLATLPRKTMRRWRHLALSMALLGGQSATARALLSDGADPNDEVLVPRLKSRFYNQMVGTMTQDPRFGGAKGVHAMKKSGLLSNGENRGPVPLVTAIQCNNVAETRLLLQHGADPLRYARPHNPPRRQGPDPFMVAVMDGNPAILRLLMSHGAQPCPDDRRLAFDWNLQTDHRRKQPATVAGIARHAGVSGTLLARLVCHRPSSSH
ncbi:MAG TPA: hypothetical protein VF269_03130 [Rhodanobacteraceae bacterium]